ncbi:hypothetical protein [Paenibacillus sp. FSL H8-0537]|uniref:hypothetical protein n=1 Tax=Paenibacillus sp. FSL H8-0537 TaxID=2921399 RepID=UPI0031010F14
MMEMQRLVDELMPYAGSRIKVWMEDRSGEKQTLPKPYTLFKVEAASDGTQLLFYFNKEQFLSVPVFDEKHTLLEQTKAGPRFVSHDEQSQLHYWVYFL